MSDIRAVASVGASFTITLSPEAEPTAVKFGGRTAIFGAGWTPSFAYVGFAPLIILDLSNSNGQKASWILDHGGERLGDKVSDLRPTDRELLRQCAQDVLSNIAKAWMADPLFGENLQAREYFSLNRNFRSDIEGSFAGFLPNGPQARQMDPSTEVIAHVSKEKTLPLNGKRLLGSLSVDLHKQYLNACRSGVMTWQSPVDGEVVSEVRGLVLSPLLMAWRCVDARHSLTFFIIVSGFDQETAGLFIPAAQLFISLPRIRFTQVSIESAVIVPAIANHIFEHGGALQSYISKRITRFAQFTWPRGAAHIGHYIWNELSGLEQLVLEVGSDSLPLVFDLGGAGGQEFFGPLAQIFPELQSLISKRFLTIAEMLNHAYQAGIQVFRFSARYVSESLRTRLLNLVAGCPEAEIARQTLFTTDGPVIVFGLRVENRTIVCLADFYIALARLLAAEFGAITLIIDGHNSTTRVEGASTFESFLEHRATRKPLECEIEIVAQMENALRGDPVHIINCVAQPVPANLAWLSQADYCVAPWGAGLAKARWVCNLPAYVLLSNFCRDHKNDIHIYSDPEFMQCPSSVQLVSRSLVRDRPEEPVVLKMDDVHTPYYVNYSVDVNLVGPEVVKALRVVKHEVGWRRKQPHAHFDIRGDVLKGTNDELFLANGGHHVLDFALGYRKPTERSFKNFCENISARFAAAEKLNAKYVHVIFPDKHSVIPEALDIENAVCLGDIYAQHCGAVWDKVAYLKSELRESKQSAFQKNDTHMTHDGTLTAAAHVLRKLYGNSCDAWVATMRKRPRGTRVNGGDLGSKLSPTQSEELEYFVRDGRLQCFANQMNTGNNGAMTIYLFPDAERSESVVLFGDSFGSDFCFILANLFQQIVFFRTPFVHAELLDLVKPDVVISENVERYLGNVYSDRDRPNFFMMNTMTYGETDAKKFATAFSALTSCGRSPHNIFMDEVYRRR